MSLHVAINGWFWDRSDTGSGQYLRHLVGAFAEIAPRLRITLVVPAAMEVEPPGPSVRVLPVPLKGRGQWAKLRFEQRQFPQAAADAGADIVHVPYWGGPLNSPLPVIVTIHDIIPLILPTYRGGLLGRIYTSLVAATARGAAAVLTDSVASKSDILDRLGLPADRVTVIPLAAAPVFRPHDGGLVDVAVRRKYDLPEDFALYLGGYDVRKNVRTLLHAYSYIQTGAGDMYPLVLAGKLPDKTGPRFTDVAGLIEALELQDAVRCIGWVDEDDKPALYRLATCFVFPSMYEGFGLPVLEALACGTPVVAANTSSIPEIVGDAGFLVDSHDPRHMAGSMLALYNQPDLRADLSQRALKQAEQFSWKRTIIETLAVYEQVAGITG